MAVSDNGDHNIILYPPKSARCYALWKGDFILKCLADGIMSGLDNVIMMRLITDCMTPAKSDTQIL